MTIGIRSKLFEIFTQPTPQQSLQIRAIQSNSQNTRKSSYKQTKATIKLTMQSKFPENVTIALQKFIAHLQHACSTKAMITHVGAHPCPYTVYMLLIFLSQEKLFKTSGEVLHTATLCQKMENTKILLITSFIASSNKYLPLSFGQLLIEHFFIHSHPGQIISSSTCLIFEV